MSQNFHKLADGRVVMWGKDHALGWFLDVHKNGDIDTESVITEKSTAFDGLTLEQMQDELLGLGVPKDKI